jgi:hypothetical protein
MIKSICIFLVIFVFILIYHCKERKLELGTYTSYPNYYSYTPDVKAYIGIIRHGERYPTKNVFKKIDKSIGITKYNDLTPNGYMNMYMYGLILNRMYPQIFNHENNYNIYSTTVKRALESASGVLKGLNSNKKIIYGDTIDSFLKINKFFIKQDVDGDTYSCQFADILYKKKYDKCNYKNIENVEKRHDQINYQSIVLNHQKGLKLYTFLLLLIKKCMLSDEPHGSLFFCHDSTLAPLFYYFKLLPNEADFKNSEMLPFGARIEIVIDYHNNIMLFLNGKYIKNI